MSSRKQILHLSNTRARSATDPVVIICAFAFAALRTIYRVHIKIQATILSVTKTRLCNILQFFTVLENDNFLMNIFYIFLIFAQNIDFGYMFEPPN